MHASVHQVICGSSDIVLPVFCRALTHNNGDLFLLERLGTNFNEIWIKIQIFKEHFSQFWRQNGGHFGQASLG